MLDLFHQWLKEGKTRPTLDGIPTHVQVDVAASFMQITPVEDQFLKDDLPHPQSKSQSVDLFSRPKRSLIIQDYTVERKSTTKVTVMFFMAQELMANSLERRTSQDSARFLTTHF